MGAMLPNICDIIRGMGFGAAIAGAVEGNHAALAANSHAIIYKLGLWMGTMLPWLQTSVRSSAGQ